MPEIRRHANVRWEGPLEAGYGWATTRSGTLTDVPLTWKARVDDAGESTNPEELIAAAHASCYAMSLAATLAGAQIPPARLEVGATVTLRSQEDGGYAIARSALRAQVEADDVPDDRLRELAREAEAGLPGVERAARRRGDHAGDAEAAREYVAAARSAL